MGDINKFRGTNKIRSKTPFGDNHSEKNLGQSSVNINMTDLGKTYGSVFVPRNVSFAKNLIDNYEGNSLQSRKYERKKNNELNISQAINDYNSYKNKEKLKKSKSPPSSLSNSLFNLRESQYGIKPNSIKGRNVPLNLLEIFSNTEVGAFSLKFTKYNNPVTIDSLSIQIGTIRLNLFANYLLDILRILSEYKKATNAPKIATSQGNFSPDGQTILEMQEYFYNYLLKEIPDIEKTDSMNEYMEYLRKEIISKKKYSSKPEHFTLNQLFSFFPKGFDFHFDYENIEIVAYDKDNVVSSKIIIPSSEIILTITFTKIFIKLLELEMEITDLNKCEKIIEQLKDLAKDKFKVIEIVIEPCYKQLKDGIEILKGNNSNNIPDYKQKLVSQSPKPDHSLNNNHNSPIIKQIENIQQDESENENLEINQSPQKQFILRNKGIYKRPDNQRQKEMEPQELLRKEKEQHLLIQKQKQKQKEQEQQLLLIKQQQEKERQIQIQKQKEALVKQQELERKQKLLLQQQKEQKRQQELKVNQNIPQKKGNIPQNQIGAQKKYLLSNMQLYSQQQQQKNLLQSHSHQNILNSQQQQNKPNNQNIKLSRMPAPTANKMVQIPKPNEAGPKDSVRKSGYNKMNNSGNNIYNYNLPKMERQHSSYSYQRSAPSIDNLNFSPQNKQHNINYGGGNIINNKVLINTNNNKANQKVNYIYQSNQNNSDPQDSIPGKGNNKRIIKNNNNGFNLLNDYA